MSTSTRTRTPLRPGQTDYCRGCGGEMAGAKTAAEKRLLVHDSHGHCTGCAAHRREETPQPDLAPVEPSDLSWQARAACRHGVDPELFHPVGNGPAAQAQAERAKLVCRDCPVIAACLDYAIDVLPYGVAGGTDELERAAIRKRRRPA